MMFGFWIFKGDPSVGSSMNFKMEECHALEFIIQQLYVKKEELLEWWLYMEVVDKLKKIIMDHKDNYQSQH